MPVMASGPNPVSRRVRHRRSLFQKYFLVLFLAVVIPLAVNGATEAWFGYRDQRARLDQLLGVEARSAASRIQGFLDSITGQLGWLVQLPWSDGLSASPGCGAGGWSC